MSENLVDVDAMEKAAALLVTHGESMSKAGFNMDTGVHVDENGLSSPALASEGDAGSLDALMIGRATRALFAAGKMVTPASIAAMVGRMEDMDDEDEELDPAYAKSEAFRKSSADFLATYGDHPDVAETIDGNFIVEQILDKTSGHLAQMRHTQGSFAKSQGNFNGKLANALREQGRLIKSLDEMVRKGFGLADRAPVSAPAAVRTPERAASMAKGGSAPAASPSAVALTKAQLTSVLDYMGMEKSITNQGPVNVLQKSALIAG